MKRVGILTFHHVHNFGAVLQAWSLADAVRRLGHSVEVINYQPTIGHVAKRSGWRKFVPSLGKIRNQRFVTKHIPATSKVLETREDVTRHIDETGYDVLICGSDQVWMIYEHQGVDLPYFLGVGSSADLRRVSYAPSAGSTRSFGAFKSEVDAVLKSFNAVSVRDSNTMAAASELGIKDITRVVDPTIIADFSDIINADKKNNDIVVVGKMNAAADEYIKFAAKTLGCKVRAVGTRCESADKQQPFASPLEWLQAVSSARLVITSLFHGAAVSLSTRTPFVALDCGGRAFKLEDLCGYMNIPDRLLIADQNGAYAQDADLLTREDSELEAHLSDKIAQSKTFLDEAIRG